MSEPVFKEGAESLRPRPVSREFIAALRQAGARPELCDELERQREPPQPYNGWQIAVHLLTGVLLVLGAVGLLVLGWWLWT